MVSSNNASSYFQGHKKEKDLNHSLLVPCQYKLRDGNWPGILSGTTPNGGKRNTRVQVSDYQWEGAVVNMSASESQGFLASRHRGWVVLLRVRASS